MYLNPDLRLVVFQHFEHEDLILKLSCLSKADRERILSNTHRLDSQRKCMYVNLDVIQGLPLNLDQESAVKTRFAFAHTIEIDTNNEFYENKVDTERCSAVISRILTFARQSSKKLNLSVAIDIKDRVLFDLVAGVIQAQHTRINKFEVQQFIQLMRINQNDYAKILSEKFVEQVPKFTVFEFAINDVPNIVFSQFSNLLVLKVRSYVSEKLDLRPCKNLQELMLVQPELDFKLDDIRVAGKVNIFSLYEADDDMAIEDEQIIKWNASLLRNMGQVKRICEGVVVHVDVDYYDKLELYDFQDTFKIETKFDTRTKCRFILTSNIDENFKIEFKEAAQSD